MSRLSRVVCVLAAAVATLAVADLALADSRLFTVRTDEPGVTIIGAYRNGKQLAVGGHNASDTIFRIDNPSGQVPCTNRFQFTTSDGQSIDSTANLCTSNWDITVSLSGGVVGTGGGSPPQGGTLPGTGQPVVIATDDPTVTIMQVFLRGHAVPIAARQDPYVQINVLGGPTGFQCERDLGLALSDGRRIARLVDICLGNFLVVVPLVGGPRPPPPPPSMRPPVVQFTPPAPQPEPLPTPEPPIGPEVVDNMSWLFSAQSNRASFAYGIPNTDASEFTAVCAARSAQVTITLSRTADELGPDGEVTVRFSGGAFSGDYTATGSEVSELDGLSHPVMEVATSDPLWTVLIKEKALGIEIGSSDQYFLSLRGSATKAKQFLAVCNPQVIQPLPEPQPLPQPFPGDVMEFACDDGSFLQVSFDNASAAVSEFGMPPVILFRAPAPVGQRWVAGASELRAQGDQIVWSRDGGDERYCLRQ